MLPLTDPILVFTILIFAILVAPILAGKLRVPDLVLLLLAGILLGPQGFGVLERSSAIILLGSVGLLYIMFLAGLEIDLHNFSRSGKRSILFGLLTFAVPQTLGALVGRFFLGFSWPASILMASMFASHTLLAYPIASRLGIARSEPVNVAVGATIITDTLALLVLAVIADMARGMDMNVGFWLSIGIGMVVLVLATGLGIPRLARWFFHKVTEEGNTQFLFVLAVVCCCSYFSHLAKMEPIIGAFFVGAAFNRLIPEQSVLMNRIVFAGNTLFIPFFLISVGMLVDPVAVLSDPRCWLVAAVMIVLVIVTKYAASWIAGTIFGYRSDEKNIMFGLSVVQAAATLAAALVGYDLGIIDDTILNGAIAMIAVTCPLGAWMVDRQGRKMAAQMETRASPDRTEQRLLVLIANPVHATRMLDLSFLLRDKTKPGSIHPVTIVRDEGDTEDAVARGEKLLAYSLTHAASADIPVDPSVHVDVNISDAIIRASKELRSTIVLAGWHEAPPRHHRFFGPIMLRLMDSCPARMFICRLKQPLNTARRLVVLFPPLIERRRDLNMLMNDLKHLSLQAGADIYVYAVGRKTEELLDKLKKTPPKRPVKSAGFESMADARARMLDEIGKDDMIILPCERNGSVFWTPIQDKLSELIFSRFPNNNAILMYPDVAGEDDYFLSPGSDPYVDSFSVRPCELDSGMGLQNALGRIADTAFPDDAAASEKAGKILIASADSYMVEIIPEVALLHLHTEDLSRPVLVVGHGRNCCEMPGLKSPPRIILALFSPASHSPEQHLKSLAEIGRLFHDASAVDRIRNAADAAEIAGIISGR